MYRLSICFYLSRCLTFDGYCHSERLLISAASSLLPDPGLDLTVRRAFLDLVAEAGAVSFGRSREDCLCSGTILDRVGQAILTRFRLRFGGKHSDRNLEPEVDSRSKGAS
jgi:hypothetical protein